MQTDTNSPSDSSIGKIQATRNLPGIPQRTQIHLYMIPHLRTLPRIPNKNLQGQTMHLGRRRARWEDPTRLNICVAKCPNAIDPQKTQPDEPSDRDFDRAHEKRNSGNTGRGEIYSKSQRLIPIVYTYLSIKSIGCSCI